MGLASMVLFNCSKTVSKGGKSPGVVQMSTSMRPMRLNPGGSGVRGDSTPCCRCCSPACCPCPLAASASAAAEALLCAALPSAPRLWPPWLPLWRLPLESHGSSLLQGHRPQPQPLQTCHRSPCTSTSPDAGAVWTCTQWTRVCEMPCTWSCSMTAPRCWCGCGRAADGCCAPRPETPASPPAAAAVGDFRLPCTSQEYMVSTGAIWHQTATLCQQKIRTARASHLQVLRSKGRSPSDAPPPRSRTDPQLLRATARRWTLASAARPGGPPCASAAAAAAAVARLLQYWPRRTMYLWCSHDVFDWCCCCG